MLFEWAHRLLSLLPLCASPVLPPGAGGVRRAVHTPEAQPGVGRVWSPRSPPSWPRVGGPDRAAREGVKPVVGVAVMHSVAPAVDPVAGVSGGVSSGASDRRQRGSLPSRLRRWTAPVNLAEPTHAQRPHPLGAEPAGARPSGFPLRRSSPAWPHRHSITELLHGPALPIQTHGSPGDWPG